MQVTRVSILTGTERTRDLPITEQELARFEGGELVQNVWPQLTPGDREFIMTGITEEEWEENFKEED